MTAILTIEHCKLTDTATVSHNAIYSVPVGYSHAYLVEGEELTINQLLHILLIPSANDAAVVLAEHIAGSVESFSTMMNTKALELGCKNTHFVNPNGIHSSDHYSTAYDLALIGRYAMNLDTFREIVTKTNYTLPSTNKYDKADRFFKQTNSLVVPNDSDSFDNYYYQYATGIKTGYTVPAGECIVASAKKNDIEYIAVVLGSERLENGLSTRYIDCKTLFNYAFDNFRLHNVNKENTILKQLKVSKANIFNNNLDVIVKDAITLVLKNDTQVSTITPTINITNSLVAPISQNSSIGTITYEVDGNTYTSELLAGNNIYESNMLNTFLTFGSMVLVVVFLVWLFKISKKPNKQGKNKNKNKNKSKERDNYLYW